MLSRARLYRSRLRKRTISQSKILSGISCTVGGTLVFTLTSFLLTRIRKLNKILFTLRLVLLQKSAHSPAGFPVFFYFTKRVSPTLGYDILLKHLTMCNTNFLKIWRLSCPELSFVSRSYNSYAFLILYFIKSHLQYVFFFLNQEFIFFY
jgi:hypothetical protein